jgi:cytoskeletal protein CcmA (bactofilin family)
MKFGSGTKDAKAGNGEITGFFGEGVEIEGEVRFRDTLRVDGRLRATVNGDGELIIGPTGEVEGEVTVTGLSVSGRIKGTVRVKERLEVHGGGRVEGDILLGKAGLVVHDGGIVEAKVQMGTAPTAPAGAPASRTAPHGQPAAPAGVRD